MTEKVKILKHPDRDDRLDRVATKIVDDLPSDLLEAYIVASKVYHFVKQALQEYRGEQVDYLITKKEEGEQ